MEIPERLKNFPINRKKAEDLAFKADWCEQTAEFAQKLNNEDIRNTNYQRAFQCYLEGGWYKQALRVAEILNSQCRKDEVYQIFERDKKKYLQ